MLTEFCGDLGYRCKATVRRRRATGPADLDITTSTRLLLAKTPEVSEWISRLSLSLSLCLSLSLSLLVLKLGRTLQAHVEIFTNTHNEVSHILPANGAQGLFCLFVCFKLLGRVILLWLDKYSSK